MRLDQTSDTGADHVREIAAEVEPVFARLAEKYRESGSVPACTASLANNGQHA